ncbi:MAG: alginate export family protein [Azoarcus sp.]|jgi:hypothetical protein|nr:alginate export family protein [Azoarcus sp.]
MKPFRKPPSWPRYWLLPLLSGLATAQAIAGTLHEKDGVSIGLEVESMLGIFHSEEKYADGAGKNWQEGYFKATLTGERTFSSASGFRLYGGLGGIALATFGDGDAGGYTKGDERRAKLENAYAGFKAGGGFIDFSLGRQKFQLGDGFLIAGDAISLGNGPLVAEAKVNRGGAYYLAAQKSFDKTAVLRINPEGQWRGSLFWLKSDVAYQQETELAGIDLEHVDKRGTLGVSVLDILDVKKDSGLGLWNKRKGMKVYSLRGQGGLGVENLFLSFEYVAERGGDTAVKNHGEGWYIEGGWTFANAPLAPTINYRHAYFSADKPRTGERDESFDPLFFGLTRGLGTWFQGEVAANYAGPVNSGNTVDRLELTLNPSKDLSVTLQAWKFRRVGHAPRLDGREIDLFAWWQLNEYITIVPLIGFYKPEGRDAKAAQGNGNTNMYAQGIVMFNF